MANQQQSGDKRMKGEWGKSLLEVLIVLGIVAITAVLTGEAFLGATLTNQLGAVQRNMAAELRKARQWAVTRREAIRVTFTVGGAHLRTTSHRKNGITLGTYDFSHKGISIHRLSNGPQVVFYQSGRTATPTTITLKDANGRQVRLTISITGKVVVQ